MASLIQEYVRQITPGLSSPLSKRYVPRVSRSVSVVLMTSRPVVGSLSFQNGRSTITKVFDDCMYRVLSSAVHSLCENRLSSHSIWVVRTQLWHVASTAGKLRTTPQTSVIANPLSACAIRATPALVAPECSDASVVPLASG